MYELNRFILKVENNKTLLYLIRDSVIEESCIFCNKINISMVNSL